MCPFAVASLITLLLPISTPDWLRVRVLFILCRAHVWQGCFASNEVESVANTTAFMCPATLDFGPVSQHPMQLRSSLEIGELKGLSDGGKENGVGPYPLTYSQESLWFIDQMLPDLALYNLPEAWLLKGRLDIAALQSSLSQLVRRHEALRTCFRDRSGKPEQFILDNSEIKLRVRDLTRSENPQEKLREELAVEARHTFCLAQAPLARATLFVTAPQEQVLLLNLHHIISDAWSQQVLMQDLAQFYAASLSGTSSVLAPIPIQFADFALWQREMVESEFGRQQLAYWTGQLQRPFKPLRLPSDHRPASVRSYKGVTQFHDLPADLVESLRELSNNSGATLFMTLLAGFNVLLKRYTLEDEIVVGVPMACRERVELERLIGFCVNTHALRFDLAGDPTFAELLGRVREVVLEGYAHQEVPYECVSRALNSPRPAPGVPVFPVVFGYQGESSCTWTLPDLQVSRIELDTGTSKFDWTLLLSESQKGVILRSEFSTDLFEPTTMARLIGHFQALLRGIVASPNSRISQLPLQTGVERDQLLSKWNETSSEYERNLGIHQVFEAEAARRPKAVALSFAGQAMTYGELNGQANQLARRLRTYGVRPGVKVGLGCERSLEMVIAMLAILKAGGIYVPLDRTYPTARLGFMLNDCQAHILLTDSRWAARQDPALVRQVVCVDQELQTLSHESSENLDWGSDPLQPAYVMYTSGSTGTPKGAVIPHRAVVRLVRNTNYLDFSPNLVFLQLASISFDASTFEIWGALLNGAKLVLFPPHIPSLEELGRAIRENGITTLWLTAGLFDQMAERQLENLRGLKHLLAGGDVLSPAQVSKALRELKGCGVINGYGPTENTTFTCCYQLPVSWPVDRPIPIGKPIANTQVYVLDRNLQPVPLGFPGELCTDGDGLALGYLNQPELTAEKFVPHPFASGASRIYRTGDLVRWLPDGNLEFIGRSDAQLKIRGYRVEPGEVESVLASHPAVEAAFVTVHSDSSAGKQLTAYIVARNKIGAAPEKLRQFLEARLPAYLIPAHFVCLERLPLTPNGKVDRAALPEPDFDRNGTQKELVMPGSPTEKLVAKVWSEVLGNPRIGIHEDFFRLGGHSLLATQVISRLSESCQFELPLQAIFECPTIAQLASAIDHSDYEFDAEKLPLITPGGPERAAELLQRIEDLTDDEVEALLVDPELKALL